MKRRDPGDENEASVYIHASSTESTWRYRNMDDDMTMREREYEEQYCWWIAQLENNQTED